MIACVFQKSWICVQLAHCVLPSVFSGRAHIPRGFLHQSWSLHPVRRGHTGPYSDSASHGGALGVHARWLVRLCLARQLVSVKLSCVFILLVLCANVGPDVGCLLLIRGPDNQCNTFEWAFGVDRLSMKPLITSCGGKPLSRAIKFP